jgi:hypothetical protein
MSGVAHVVDSQQALLAMHAQIDKDFIEHGHSSYSVTHGISGPQFSALHVYCAKCAEVFNAAGIDVRAMIDEMKIGFNIPHDKDTFKKMVYKPILKTITDKDSTKDQTTVEPKKVTEAISYFMASRFGLVAPEWPAKKKNK